MKVICSTREVLIFSPLSCDNSAKAVSDESRLRREFGVVYFR